jgi:hypothetical protein
MEAEGFSTQLNGEYENEEMKCLMSVGLWCAHPDQKSRPSSRQAIQVLNSEAPLPSLPSHMPVPLYYLCACRNDFNPNLLHFYRRGYKQARTSRAKWFHPNALLISESIPFSPSLLAFYSPLVILSSICFDVNFLRKLFFEFQLFIFTRTPCA